MSEHAHHDHAHEGAHEHHAHVMPVSTLLIVFVSLMVFMFLTIFVAYQPLGYFNLPIALAIAMIKATLVVLFFMEVKYGSRLLWVFAGSSFVFLLIMLVLTMNDYVTRGWNVAGY